MLSANLCTNDDTAMLKELLINNYHWHDDTYLDVEKNSDSYQKPRSLALWHT